MIEPQLRHYPEHMDLEECARGHEIAVITDDEYHIKELFEADKDIKYIIDIGANIGAAAYQFQSFFPNAKILVCEPLPDGMKFCKINTENKLTYVEEAIIGDDRKEVTFNVCDWAGNGHVDGNFRWDLFTPMGSKLNHKIQVKACTLKELIDKHDFPRIDLLKIDTEGMEGQILTNFKPYLNLVKHFRGEWHGDVDREVMKLALQDTHEMYIDKRLMTHGDFFAISKEISVATQQIEQKNGYKIIKRIGLPNKIIYD